jgi:xylonate dehydratase
VISAESPLLPSSRGFPLSQERLLLKLARMSSRNDVPEAAAPEIYQIQTRARGPAGSLPLTEEILLNGPSGDSFGPTQNAGMGWNPAEVGRKQFLILSTQGGLRAPDGKPIALGYHTGHWEIGLLVQAAAVAELGRRPLRAP